LSKFEENLDSFIVDLLHVDDKGNKLINLAGKGVYFLSCNEEEVGKLYKYALSVIKERIGKPANTELKGSSLKSVRGLKLQRNVFEWRGDDGDRDPEKLDRFIKDAYSALSQKGINTLFLSVGAVEWSVPMGGTLDEETTDVLTPLLVFPIRLIRASDLEPVCIEFVDDAIYLNPCFIAKLRAVYRDELADKFPHPNGSAADKDETVDLVSLGDGKGYFDLVEEFMTACKGGESDIKFDLRRNVAAISLFNHDEICMYYDVRRNKKKLLENALVRSIFGNGGDTCGNKKDEKAISPKFVLPKDSEQERIIKEAVGGESLIVKGPPGTGKTLTIANMVAALLAEGKKVLLSSQKLSALSEVQKKLPDNLQDFVMLLDCETEAQAARLNPETVKRGLFELLGRKRGNIGEIIARRDAERRNMAASLSEIKKYYSETFDGSVSFYKWLDIFCKSSAEPVKLSLLREIGANERDAEIRRAERAGRAFDAMTDGGKHGIAKCPWYFAGGFKSSDIETLRGRFVKLMPAAERAVRFSEDKFKQFGISLSDVKLKDVREFANGKADEDAIRKICAIDETFAEELRLAVWQRSILGDCSLGFDAKKDDGELNIGGVILPDWLDEKTLGLANKFAALIRDGLLDAPRLFELEKEYELALEKSKTARARYTKIFRSDLREKEFNVLKVASDALDKFKSETELLPLDFAAKRAYKRVKPLSNFSEVEFAETVSALKYFRTFIEAENEVANLEKLLSRLFGRELSREQIDGLFGIAKACSEQSADIKALAMSAERDFEVVTKYAEKIGVKEYSVGELRKARDVCMADKKIEELIKKADLTGIPAKAALAGYDVFTALADKGYAAEKVHALLLSLSCEETEFIDRLIASFKALNADEKAQKTAKTISADEKTQKSDNALSADEKAQDFVSNIAGQGCKSYYAICAENLTFADIGIFNEEALDRNVTGAAEEYFSILADKKPLDLAEFFKPFEEEKRFKDGASFKELFEHSLADAAIKWKLASFDARNARGARIEKAIGDYRDAEKRLLEINAQMVEYQLLSGLDKSDRRFAFLNAERDTTLTLRKMFKNNAAGILALKKCLLLSPSTVSVLMGGDEYFDFDAVIIDEASQLMPVGILPLLIRAKQCILVGDEWQMPPIEHFKTRTDKLFEDGEGEFEILDPDVSALSLALRSKAFKTCKLGCHYRSKTESLIAFSQHRYYRDMQTFPAPTPYAEDLGLSDVYIENGILKNGANEAEAQAVIEHIAKYFDRYYDEKSGTLCRSLGVITFGEAQLKLVKQRFEENGALKAKYDKALSRFDGNPENLVFFKTIEKSQGCEADDLILSLTYGRTENGIVQAFGQLNKSKLGQCIFNVAVTRARSSVTVIHSIKAEEITNENISYIKEYLELVRRFGRPDGEQFVYKKPEAGFLKSVGEYIRSLGIGEDRIVYNYGVTDGSVRVPIAILDEKRENALIGLWCESAVPYEEFLDRNMRRFDSLKDRGWKLERICAADWCDNAVAERAALKDILEKYDIV